MYTRCVYHQVGVWKTCPPRLTPCISNSLAPFAADTPLARVHRPAVDLLCSTSVAVLQTTRKASEVVTAAQTLALLREVCHAPAEADAGREPPVFAHQLAAATPKALAIVGHDMDLHASVDTLLNFAANPDAGSNGDRDSR